MSAHAAPREYRLTRPDGLGFFRRRSAAQFAICCAGIGCGLLGLVVTGAGEGGRVGLAVIALVLVVLGATRLPGGEDLLALLGSAAHYGARRATGRRRWSAALVPLRGGELPPLFAGLRLNDLDSGPVLGLADAAAGRRVGVVLDRADGAVSAVLRVHGEGFLLADEEVRDERLASFGEALASCGRDASPVLRVAWSQFVGPPPLSGHLAYLAATRRREPDTDIASAYDALLQDQASRAVAAEVLVTLSVGLSRVRAGRGTDRLGAAIERLLEECELLIGALGRAGLAAIGPLPAGAIARSLRARLDPSAERHLEARARSLGDLLGLVTPENGFPLSIEEHRREVLVDQSWHRLYRVAEWPRVAVRADWLASFLCGETTRTLTLVFTPVPRAVARRQALATATRVGANIDERELRGRRVGAEELRARLAADALDDELESGAQLELVAGLVDVCATDHDALDVACERVGQSAASVGIELRPLALRQGEALVAALALGRLVPGRGR